MQTLPDALTLIDLEQPLPGFRRFISCWLYRPGPATILVDPGPASTIPKLMTALRDLGVNRLDCILLSHVHLDHGGGLDLLLAEFPGCRVVCHPRGMEHLSNPSRLWEVSLRNLGPIAEMYGKPGPVPPDALFYRDRFEIRGISVECHDTPGHAPHHLVFKSGSVVFAGEATGICLALEEGFYRRLGAPPGGFRFPDYRRSLDLIAGLGGETMCFAHWGWTPEPGAFMTAAAAQADLWLAVSRRHAAFDEEEFRRRVLAELLETDRGLSLLSRLPSDIQARERALLPVSIGGMRPYAA